MAARRKSNIPWFCLLFILMCYVSFSACQQPQVYEANHTIENKSWYYDDVLVFETEIQDTAPPYNLYVHIRHSSKYAYANLWLKIKTVFPDGTERTDPLNIPMANDEGRWYGSGVGSVLSNQVQIQKNAILQQIGKYRFEIWQDMRVDPIPEIMDVGFMIEKAEGQ